MATTQFTARLDEQDIELFKQFVQDNNLTTAQAFNSMINLLELDKAKATIASRSKEIEQFQSYANSMIKAFINSLEINENAENRIREEFAKQLDSQLDTIADLRFELVKAQEEKKTAVENAKAMVAKAQETVTNAEADRKKAQELNSNLMVELDKKRDQIQTDKEIIAVLKSYEEDAKNYKQAKEQINELKNSISELNLHIKDLDIEHQKEIYELEKSHHTALKNREETIESKYQQEITDLRAEINQLRTMLYEKKD